MAEKKTFEKSLTELEEVVRRLESGELALDDSLLAFEDGMRLARECGAKLSSAKGKVEKLIRDSEGNTKTEKFEAKE